jgi:hypothetical protein
MDAKLVRCRSSEQNLKPRAFRRPIFLRTKYTRIESTAQCHMETQQKINIQSIFEPSVSFGIVDILFIEIEVTTEQRWIRSRLGGSESNRIGNICGMHFLSESAILNFRLVETDERMDYSMKGMGIMISVGMAIHTRWKQHRDLVDI